VRAVVDANAETIDEFAPQPRGNRREAEPGEREDERERRGNFGGSIRFARVRAGIANQSTKPKTAASNAPMTPAAIIQNANSTHR
jgi:hypothetical protein